jgi:Fe-S-cluster containining protein
MTAAAIPCFGCTANCCDSYIVTVNAHDIVRLWRGFGRSPEPYIQLHPARDAEKGVLLLDGCFDIALAHHQSGECVFLIEDEGVRRCSVHGMNPGACRAYPFRLDSAGDLLYVEDLLCPRGWVLLPEQEEAIKADLRRWQEDEKTYESLVAAWNSAYPSGGTLAAFLDYLRDALDAPPMAASEPASAPWLSPSA